MTSRRSQDYTLSTDGLPEGNALPAADLTGPQRAEAAAQQAELRAYLKARTPVPLRFQQGGVPTAEFDELIDAKMRKMTITERITYELEMRERNRHESEYIDPLYSFGGGGYDDGLHPDEPLDDGIPPPSPQVAGTRRNWYR